MAGSEAVARVTYYPHSWQTELGWESLQNDCEEGKFTTKIL